MENTQQFGTFGPFFFFGICVIEEEAEYDTFSRTIGTVRHGTNTRYDVRKKGFERRRASKVIKIK